MFLDVKDFWVWLIRWHFGLPAPCSWDPPKHRRSSLPRRQALRLLRTLEKMMALAKFLPWASASKHKACGHCPENAKKMEGAKRNKAMVLKETVKNYDLITESTHIN
jgi:hypothetical protein